MELNEQEAERLLDEAESEHDPVRRAALAVKLAYELMETTKGLRRALDERDELVAALQETKE
jgi:hypothetical protein